MNLNPCYGYSKAGGKVFLAALLLILSSSLSFASDKALSLRFKFAIDSFRGTPFSAPSGIFVDNKNRELYVADGGRSDVLIFDTSGAALFAVGRNRGVANPFDVVAKDGRIYVSEDGKNQIDVYGYRGELSGRLVPEQGPFSPGMMALDADGNIYAINRANTTCAVFDANGVFLTTVGKGLTSLAGVAVSKDRIYLITPYDSRAVQVYDKQGRRIMAFEALEDRGGTLGLPVSAKVDQYGLLWVLDALRGIVVYDEQGKEAARFSIIGKTRGALFFPVDIEIDAEDSLYVLEKGGKKISIFKIER